MTRIMPRIEDDSFIWDEGGRLCDIALQGELSRQADVAVIIVNRDRSDLVDELLVELDGMGANLDMDVYIIEMGSHPDKLCKSYTYYYRDDEFRGKCFGHNVGLRIARNTARYRYYWILMNDIRFDPGVDAIQQLVDVADQNPHLAILSPTERDSNYPSSRPLDKATYHLVSTCDYLGFLMRAQAVDEIGFLNPAFKYSWGAIHELSYLLYRQDYHVAYCDRVRMKHLGGTTYGKTKNTISREEYQRNAKAFCADYFRAHYGDDWDSEFTRVLPAGIEVNTYKKHRRYWEMSKDNKKLSWMGRIKNGASHIVQRLRRG